MRKECLKCRGGLKVKIGLLGSYQSCLCLSLSSLRASKVQNEFNIESRTWIREVGQRLVRGQTYEPATLPERRLPARQTSKSRFSCPEPETSPMAGTEEKINQLAFAVETMTTLLQTLNTKVNDMEKNPTSSMVKNMEKLFQKFNNGAAYHESPNYDQFLSARLPEKFFANDLPKFKPTDDPRFHLKGFRATMALKGIDPALFPTVFISFL